MVLGKVRICKGFTGGGVGGGGPDSASLSASAWHYFRGCSDDATIVLALPFATLSWIAAAKWLRGAQLLQAVEDALPHLAVIGIADRMVIRDGCGLVKQLRI
jgi:hypothetical protein